MNLHLGEFIYVVRKTVRRSWKVLNDMHKGRIFPDAEHVAS